MLLKVVVVSVVVMVELLMFILFSNRILVLGLMVFLLVWIEVIRLGIFSVMFWVKFVVGWFRFIVMIDRLVFVMWYSWLIVVLFVLKFVIICVVILGGNGLMFCVVML